VLSHLNVMLCCYVQCTGIREFIVFALARHGNLECCHALNCCVFVLPSLPLDAFNSSSIVTIYERSNFTLTFCC
jgi:hypothetical protein